MIWCDAIQKAYTHGALAIGVDDTPNFYLILIDTNWAPLKLKEFAGSCQASPSF